MKNREKLIEIDYETIGVEELRLLNDLSKLNIALTKEEYFRIVNIYAGVLNRLNNKLPEGY
ncbi:hypothetical protein [uncultured Clostridium sp.]|uniref:hypothetical protein n=1 Tax=uncultured Clostridium sp. TaxID=59620 RepID=UPI0026DCEC96|nr:hypothetical protein [uncultured Clostridium sp.]